MNETMLAGLVTHLSETSAPPGAPLLVAMHGIGADEADLAPLYRAFAPAAVVALPRAPLDYPPGFSWYELLRPGMPDPASFERGQARLGEWLAALRAREGHADRPLVLSGFSQGAAMALAYALQHPAEVAGVMAFSGYLPPWAAAPADVPSPPAFLTLGRHDPLFPFSRLAEAAAAFEAGGGKASAVPHDGGHEIPPSAARAAFRWFAETFPQG